MHGRLPGTALGHFARHDQYIPDIFSPKIQDNPQMSMVQRFTIILNVMVRIRVKIRIPILTSILTLILTVDVLPLVNVSFPKSYQVNKILNFPVPVSTQLPGLSGYDLVPTFTHYAI